MSTTGGERTRANRRPAPTGQALEDLASPNLRRALDEVGASLAQAIRDDPQLAGAATNTLARFQALPADGSMTATDTQPVDEAIGSLVRRFQQLPVVKRLGVPDRTIMHFVLTWLLSVTTGEQLAPPVEVRVRALPGVPSDVVATLVNEADVEALRARLAPGQVWVLMNDVDHTVWPRVSALVQFQRHALGLASRTPGRQRGSRSPARATLIAKIRAADVSGLPLKTAQIAAEATTSGVWPPGAAGDYSTVRKRVATLRRAAREG